MVLIIGGYVGALFISPQVIADNSKTLKTKEDNLRNSGQNYILIKNLNIIAPINDTDPSVALRGGAWWKNSKQASLEKDGNFVLGVTKFNLGLTPAETKEKSLFYNLDKLESGDSVEVFLNQQHYKYKVKEIKTVQEGESFVNTVANKTNLTIFTSDKSGKADGKVVLIAEPEVDPTTINNSQAHPSQNILF